MIPRTGVIVVAGGSGHRMGGALPKQFRLLGGMPVLVRTINAFAAALPEAVIVAVLPEAHVVFWQNLAARFDVAKHSVAVGGPERFHSVRNGLAALPEELELIAVHDGVRPMASSELIRRTAEAAAAHGAAVPAIVPADSFRETDGTVSRPLDRTRLRAVQTPQIFDAALLRQAYETEFSPAFTDDASVVEHTGHPIFLCGGEHRNFKITTSEDLLLADALLAADEERKEAEANDERLFPDDTTAHTTRTATADTSVGNTGTTVRRPVFEDGQPVKTTAAANRTEGKTAPERPATPAAGPAGKTVSEQTETTKMNPEGQERPATPAAYPAGKTVPEEMPDSAAHAGAHTSTMAECKSNDPNPAGTTDGHRSAAEVGQSGPNPGDDLFGGGAGAIR